MGKGKKAAIIIAAIVILIAAVVYGYVDGMLSKVHYSDGTQTPAANLPAVEEETGDTTAKDSAPEEILDAEQAIAAYLQENSTELTYDENVLNVLLIGCDSRSTEMSGRSDSMILLSMNKNTKKIIMTSIMRDIYIHIPGYGNHKLNAAFSFGGEQLLLDTMEESFQIPVEKFASVNFLSFIDVVDAVGGVTISVSDAELPLLNASVRGINSRKGLPADDGILEQSGEDLLLMGKQALGYSRIRYVGNADYERTERQRRVLEQLFEKAKSMSLMELNDLMTTVLPDVSTNLSKGELYSLLLSAPTLMQYELEQDRIPIDGSFQELVISGMDVLSIDFEKNAQEMEQRIYGE